MSAQPPPTADSTPTPETRKICPLLQAACLQESCMWWVRDWHEERNRYTLTCAVALMAIGLNDESLYRLRQRRQV